MSGTPSGSFDHCTVTAAANTQNQEIFTNLFRFFNGPLRSGSYVSLVALQYGASGTGTNFHDQSNPFGENAFAVFRVNSGSVPGAGPSIRRAQDYYVLFQWADAANFGTAPGAPARCSGVAATDGVGIAIAWRDDGLSPWNGTTNANGTDSKGASVWTAGVSVLHVLPRSNDTGGSFSVAKENLHKIVDHATAGNLCRYHFIADRDSLIAFFDKGDTHSHNAFIYSGVYEPLSSSYFVTSSGGNMQMPMVMIGDAGAGAPVVTNTYGDTAGTAVPNGGIVGPSMSPEACGARTDKYGTNLFTANLQPNVQFPLARYDEFRIPVMLYETPDFGLVGYLDILNDVFAANVYDATSGSTKVVMGVAAGSVMTVPWNSANVPVSVTTREGLQW